MIMETFTVVSRSRSEDRETKTTYQEYRDAYEALEILRKNKDLFVFILVGNNAVIISRKDTYRVVNEPILPQ